ncbi:MAG: hypothetical protein V4550_01480 [Gemmatimonadota bacterium]
MSLRPPLAALAADPTSTTVRRLWKALTPAEKADAIAACMADDENGWVRTTTRNAVAGALKFRPQTVATWPRAKLISEAARLPLDDAQLLSSYIVDLHLGHRRPMMGAFLDSLGIPNDNGRIDSENVVVPVQEKDKVSAAADALVASYPRDEVVTYFLTLQLQDSAVWSELQPWLIAGSGLG